MAFADELNHVDRRFRCGWSARAESAEEIAARVQVVARGLDEVEPAFGGLWPRFEVRALRPTDPGPVQEMSTADLARLIDRRGRAEPPQLPAPVGPYGYFFDVATQRGSEGRLRSPIQAGDRRLRADNRVDLELDMDCALWRDPERGAALLRVLIEAWSPEWVLAVATIMPEDPHASIELRPWLAWRQSAAPSSSYRPEFHSQPAIIREEGDGELSIWP